MEQFFKPQEQQVPSFFDIGTLAKDCLMRGYNIGMWRFDCSTFMDGFYIKSHGQARPELKDIIGSLEIRKVLDSPQMEIAEKWDSTKTFTSEVTVREQLSNGGEMMASFIGKYSINDDSTGNLKLGYKRNAFRIEVITPIFNDRRLFGFAVYVPKTNWLLGGRIAYHWRRNHIDMHAIGLGYNNGRTEVGLKFENFNCLRGSIFHRLNNKFDIAMKLNNFCCDYWQYVLGGQYRLRDDLLLKLKIRDDGYLGFVFQKKLRENIDVLYYLGVQSRNLFNHGHRVGVAWEFRC